MAGVLRPAFPAGSPGGTSSDALAQAIVLLLLLLGGGLTFAFAFGWLPVSGPKGRAPSRRTPSSLFPPSHHEKIHDPKYLQRILEAEEQRRRSEEQRRRSIPRAQGDPQQNPQPSPRRNPADPDPSSSPESHR